MTKHNPLAAPTPEPPAPKRYVLPSGDVAALEMPDLFDILGQVGVITDPLTAAVIKLLINEGAYTPETDKYYYKTHADQIRGMYGLYALCRKDKTVEIGRTHGDGEGVLGRLDIPYMDLQFVENVFFRAGSATPLAADPNAADADGAAEPAPDRGNVSPAAE